LDEIRKIIEPKVSELLAPIFEAEMKIQEAIAVPIKEAASKALEKAEGTLQEQFGKNLPVIGAAAEAELKLFPKNLLEAEEKVVAGTHRTYIHEYDWMQWRLNFLWAFDNGPISTMISDKFRGDSYDAIQWDLASDLYTQLMDLNQSGWTVIKENFKKDQGDFPQQVRVQYPDIIVRAGEDIKTIVFFSFLRALDRTIKPVLMDATKDILRKLCEPLSEHIPDAVKDIVDPVRTGTEILLDVLADVEVKLLEVALGDFNKKVDARAKDQASKGLVKPEEIPAPAAETEKPAQ